MSIFQKMGASAFQSSLLPTAPKQHRPYEEWSTDELDRYKAVLMERLGLVRWGGRVGGFLGSRGLGKYFAR